MKSGVKAHRVAARRAGLAGVVAATVVTAGCTAGQRAQTAEVPETRDAVTVRIGPTITLGGAAVEAPTDDVSWASGANVPLKLVVVNSGRTDDKLTSITSPSITGWNAYASAGAASAANAPSSGSAATPASSSAPSPVTIPALSAVLFGTQHAPGAPASRVLLLTGVKSTLYPGSVIEVTFTFARAGSATVEVPVQVTRKPQSSVIPGPSATGEEG